MSETKAYTGGCHCGKVRFEAQIALEKVTACNCSICSKAGWLLAFVPAAQFKLIAGEGAVTDYQFAKKHLHHPFCATCGIRSYSYGESGKGDLMYAVNTRCLDDLDAPALPVSHFDGKAL